MKLRLAAVRAGLALGLMSGVASAAPLSITYTVNYTLSDFGAPSQVTGFIETDGIIGQPLQRSDILSFSLTANGMTADDDLSIEGSGLMASSDGTLSYTFLDESEFRTESASHFDVADFYGVRMGRGTLPAEAYVYPALQQTFDAGSTFVIGTEQVSAVPLPASAPMFGAALLALGAVGYGLKRKGKASA